MEKLVDIDFVPLYFKLKNGEYKYTIAQLARELGLSPSHFSYMIRNHKPMNVPKLLQLAKLVPITKDIIIMKRYKEEKNHNEYLYT